MAGTLPAELTLRAVPPATSILLLPRQVRNRVSKNVVGFCHAFQHICKQNSLRKLAGCSQLCVGYLKHSAVGSRKHLHFGCKGLEPKCPFPRGLSQLTLGLCVICALRNDREENEIETKSKSWSSKSVEKVVKVAAILATLIVATSAVFGRGGIEQLAVAKKGKSGRKTRTMPLDERTEWTKGLPLVEERISYSDLIILKKEGKLKHIIKHPNATLQSRPYQAFVVLDDQKVFRTVFPAGDRDLSFWKSWDELNLKEAVIDAYTPSVPPVELLEWASKGPSLTFLRWIEPFLKQLSTLLDWKKVAFPKAQMDTKSRRSLLEQTRAERERRRVEKQIQKAKQLARAKQEARSRALKREDREKGEKMQQEAVLAQQEAREKKIAQEIQWDTYWFNASQNEGVQFCLGVFFFWLFYQTIVVGVNKRKQDYEDRIKILKAEAEDRKKLKEWDRTMDSIVFAQELKNVSETEKQRLEEAQNNPEVQLSLRFMKSGAHMRHAKGRSRPPQYLDLDADVKFEDVAGLGDIRKELEEIVDFFTYGDKYRRRGSKIPAGILLCGEPGVGKTLLAKAVAGEAGVNFFSISASQFVEIYVGVGASRVRALYREAKEMAPAVVFIDELDAVGRQRGLIGGSGGQERDATLNQLLTCLDGFEGKGEVITIAATNRPDILDTALVRPGRFDRKIFIPKPSVKGRVDILRVHAKKKPMAEDIDYRAVAEMTEGMVGAQLANLVDVAALAALRDGRSEITTDDLLEAAQLEEGGHPDPFVRSEKLMRMLALQEASVAAVAANFPDYKEVQLITILPRMGEEKGAARYKADMTKFQIQSVSRQGMLDHITVQLAPRAADELWNGPDQMSTIWADTVDQARKSAREFVFAGLSERKELYGLLDSWQELNRTWEVDNEALRILESCYARAIQYLKRNRSLVDALVERLMRDKTLRRPEFLELIEQFGKLDKQPPQPLEVRNMRRIAFQEKMIAEKRTSRVP